MILAPKPSLISTSSIKFLLAGLELLPNGGQWPLLHMWVQVEQV
jgi:hypothetical protein